MTQPTFKTESPFIAFCNANREQVKTANPTAEFGDVGRLLSVAWKQLNESEKELYSNTQKNNGDTMTLIAHDSPNVLGLRRSNRLRNKRLGLNFWGSKTCIGSR